MKYRRIAAAVVLAALAGCALKYEEIGRLMAVQSLFSEDKITNNFSNMGAAFLTVPVSRGEGPVSELPTGSAATLPAEIDAFITDRNVTALLVLKNGQVVFEDYYQDTDANDLRISWSVAKSFLSALMGVLVDEGTIETIDAPVTQFVPSLIGSAYDGATIKDVLQMSSGVIFDEDYLKFSSDINRMGRILALGGSMDGFAEGLTETFAPAGQQWQYVSIDTHILGMVIRGATGRTIPDLLSEKIIAPLGFEAEPTYLVDGYDVAFVLGGLNITTRDYARFGQMIAQNGQWQGRQIVPADWIAASTLPSANTAPGNTGYGYQWWIPVGAAPGQFMARGIYGQYIYIDQPRNVVIVLNASDRNFRFAGVNRQNEDMFRAIAESLD
ncbi:beta-lactamase family protein [Loktanella sp. F6476L]|uniref:serine hydrolase domain-containing protein n=1 Tax=Loktanella sp. F6476L TaxID=2926405 RepID=UPI001FF6EA86|nr:serine hydrolase [Loktanella sp. F6476L]MCK0122284.1 beta-lactamase family protein [Loktanella sp. F6476L]